MALTALLGGLGFLSRLPVGRDEAAWDAFRTAPVAFPAVGYVLGALCALPLLLPVPAPTAAVAFVAGVYLLTGITHVDGVADVGDAAVIHGNPAERRAVMADPAVGTGGTLAVAVVVAGIAAAGLALAAAPARAVLLVVVAEVGAKVAMATLVCLGSASHEGLAEAFTAPLGPRALVPVAAVAAPAAALTRPRVLPAVAALGAAVAVGLVALRWARARLGGVGGDVIGAANEIARVAALHAGVIAWTRL